MSCQSWPGPRRNCPHTRRRGFLCHEIFLLHQPNPNPEGSVFYLPDLVLHPVATVDNRHRRHLLLLIFLHHHRDLHRQALLAEPCVPATCCFSSISSGAGRLFLSFSARSRSQVSVSNQIFGRHIILMLCSWMEITVCTSLFIGDIYD